jgi:hypothetical protein
MNNQLSDEPEDDPLEGLYEAFLSVGALNIKALAGVARYKALSSIFEPALTTLFNSGNSKILDNEAAALYDYITNSDPKELQELSTRLHKLTRADLETIVRDGYMVTDHADALKRAQHQKQLVKDLSRNDITALAQGITTMLPPKTKAFLVDIGLIDNTPTGAWIKKWVAHVSSKTAEELAQEELKAAARFPVSQAVDVLESVIARVTPQTLETFFKHVKSNFTGNEFGRLVVSGLGVARDMMKSTLAHGSPAKLSDGEEAKAKLFRGQARKLLTVFEEAATAAGLAADTSKLVQPLREIYGNPDAPGVAPPPPPASPLSPRPL